VQEMCAGHASRHSISWTKELLPISWEHRVAASLEELIIGVLAGKVGQIVWRVRLNATAVCE
jgi:hypothetical protein